MNRRRSNSLKELLASSRLVVVVISFMALLACYWPQLMDILSMAARGVERGYVLMVPFVAFYLAFIRRSRWKVARRSRGAFLGVLVVALSFLASWFGHDRDILSLWQMALVIAFIGICIAAMGLPKVLAFGPAFMVLPAFVPIPGGVSQAMAQPLQTMATEVTAWVLSLLGVDAVRMGSLIEINGFQVAVGEACNGMRLLLPLGIVMYAFVFSLPLRVGTRIMLLALCLPVALTCNVIRLVPTALFYGYLPGQAEVVHEIGGWIMIPLAIGMLVGLLRLLEWADISVSRFRLATA